MSNCVYVPLPLTMTTPPPTVCSTTLWVGQVDKKATQQDLTNLFEEFGQIESINVSAQC